MTAQKLKDLMTRIRAVGRVKFRKQALKDIEKLFGQILNGLDPVIPTTNGDEITLAIDAIDPTITIPEDLTHLVQEIESVCDRETPFAHPA